MFTFRKIFLLFLPLFVINSSLPMWRGATAMQSRNLLATRTTASRSRSLAPRFANRAITRTAALFTQARRPVIRRIVAQRTTAPIRRRVFSSQRTTNKSWFDWSKWKRRVWAIGAFVLGAGISQNYSQFTETKSNKLNYDPVHNLLDPSDSDFVLMWEGKLIQMPHLEKDLRKRSIFSFGFAGCTGVGIYVLFKSGEQYAILTHYPPADINVHISNIESLCAEIKKKSNSKIEKAVAVIMHPKAWKKNCPADHEEINLLTIAIQTSFTKNTPVIQELYSYSRTLDTDDWHPYCTYHNLPKELEIVLSSNPQESYYQSKASGHIKQNFNTITC